MRKNIADQDRNQTADKRKGTTKNIGKESIGDKDPIRRKGVIGTVVENTRKEEKTDLILSFLIYAFDYIKL